MTSENRTASDALANAQFIGDVTANRADTNRSFVTILVDADGNGINGRTYLESVDNQFDEIDSATFNGWTWWKRDAGYSGVLVTDDSGIVTNQSIEVFEDRVRPTFVEYDTATTPGDFSTANTRVLSNIGFSTAYNGASGLTLQDDEGNSVLWDPTVLQPLRLSTLGGSVILSSNVDGSDDTERQATVRRAIDAASEAQVAQDIENRARSERYSLSNGNVEEWTEREGTLEVDYRAAINTVSTGVINSTTPSENINFVASAGYAIDPPSSTAYTVTFPAGNTFPADIIAEGRLIRADNTNGSGVRIFSHLIGVPSSAISEVTNVAGQTVSARVVCALRDEARTHARAAATASETFSGDGTTTVFTLTGSASSLTGITVAGAPIDLATVTFDAAANTRLVTFATAPATGTDNVVISYNVNVFQDFRTTTSTQATGLTALYGIAHDPVRPVDSSDVSVTPWDPARGYAAFDLASYLGVIYHRLVAGTTSGNPLADTTNWEPVSGSSANANIDARIPTRFEAFPNTMITRTSASVHLFRFADVGTQEQNEAERRRILRTYFGFPDNVDTLSNVALPRTVGIQIDSNTEVTLPTSVTVTSNTATADAFSIQLLNLQAPLVAATGTFAVTLRDPSSDEEFDVLIAGDGLNQSVTNLVNTLSIDDSIARDIEIPGFNASDTIGTNFTAGTSTARPVWEFAVQPNSIEQANLSKEAGAAFIPPAGSLMHVGTDNNTVAYSPGDTNRVGTFEELTDDFDIEVQDRYTRESWDANHSVLATLQSEIANTNTSPFPLRASATSRELSTQMVNELNNLDQRGTAVAIDYTNGQTYGISAFNHTALTIGQPEILQQPVGLPSIGSLGDVIDVDIGVQLSLFASSAATNPAVLRFENVRLPTDATNATVGFDEYFRRLNTLLQASNLAGDWEISTIYVDGAGSGIVVFTAGFNGPIASVSRSEMSFIYPRGQVIQSGFPVIQDGGMHESQRGVIAAGGSGVPIAWESIQTESEQFIADGTQTAFIVRGAILGISAVRADGVVQALTTDYTVSGNTVTFVTAPGSATIVEIEYTVHSDLASGQYLLFEVTSVNGNDIVNAQWLNDGIGTGNFDNSDVAFEIRTFEAATLNEANRIASNINALRNTDTGLRTLPIRTVIPQSDRNIFSEAEHDRYILISGTHQMVDAVYAHVLDIATDGSTITFDMDHYLSLNAAGTVVYRPTVTFTSDVESNISLYRLNLAGLGDVTRTGSSNQTIVRPTNFTDIAIDGIPVELPMILIYGDYVVNRINSGTNQGRTGSRTYTYDGDTYYRIYERPANGLTTVQRWFRGGTLSTAADPHVVTGGVPLQLGRITKTYTESSGVFTFTGTTHSTDT
ncbi:MAG: hypothetical protein OXU53_11475 [Deltaproteobacteria bacterium]|nr:hypothetical protein [Deltaproteobacteria bacterium]